MRGSPFHELYTQGVRFHEVGRLQEAEMLYRRVLREAPQHTEALHHLGIIAIQVGRHELAVEWIGQAIRLGLDTQAAHTNLGEACRLASRWDGAIAAFRAALRFDPNAATTHFGMGLSFKAKMQRPEAATAFQTALSLRPDYVEAANNLGVVLLEMGQMNDAVAAFRQALQYEPDYPKALNNLASTLKDQGEFEEAIEMFRRALAIQPDFAEAHYNFANLLRQRRQFEEAISSYQEALRLKPEYDEALNGLGDAMVNQGQIDKAIAVFREAIVHRPNVAKLHRYLGNLLYQRGYHDEAIGEYHSSIRIQPADADVWCQLGVALYEKGQFEAGSEAYRRAIQLLPKNPDVHNNLGIALAAMGRTDEAIACYREALAHQPEYLEARNNLGDALKDQGRVSEAIAEFRRALQSTPQRTSVHSNLLHTLLFDPGQNRRSIVDEQERWNQRYCSSINLSVSADALNRNPERRLRIAYVSPDFCNHVIGRNLIPLFKNHGHEGFEILCYSQTRRADNLTAEFQHYSDQWTNILGLNDEIVANIIRRDQVDILLDLSQHLAGNRLPVFAHHPAPIQVSFAGYPETTGLETIKYRLSDKWLEQGGIPNPDGTPVKTNGHEQVYLIDSFWCYDPCDTEVQVSELSTGNSKAITFGSLNNFCKVNEPLLKLWARVLKGVSDSKLIILSHEGSQRLRSLQFLKNEGIESNRIEFVTPRPRKEYLELHHRLDIVLDTFPYNGHTTSLDALWMGVPVVSLCGERAVSRAGLSQLSNLGLPDLVAFNEDQYVEIATKLANDIPRLKELRATLRQRMEKSVLMDAPHFARQIEACYRSMWRQWCESQKL